MDGPSIRGAAYSPAPGACKRSAVPAASAPSLHGPRTALCSFTHAASPPLAIAHAAPPAGQTAASLDRRRRRRLDHRAAATPLRSPRWWPRWARAATPRPRCTWVAWSRRSTRRRCTPRSCRLGRSRRCRCPWIMPPAPIAALDSWSLRQQTMRRRQWTTCTAQARAAAAARAGAAGPAAGAGAERSPPARGAAELFGRVLRVNYAQPNKIKGGDKGWAAQAVWADADDWCVCVVGCAGARWGPLRLAASSAAPSPRRATGHSVR